MSIAGNTGSAAAAAANSPARAGAASRSSGYNSLETDDFLKLLIQELQNQDPLDPVDNSEMVAQIGQIREIGATDQLTNSLTNLSNNQQLVTASGLIGKQVSGLSSDGDELDGVVDRVTVETNTENDTRSVKVHVGNKTMNIENIRDIQTG